MRDLVDPPARELETRPPQLTRHQLRVVRRIFDEKDWYIPMAIDIRDQLTEIEAHNIDMLLNYEEYQDDYYNDYGR